jgi:hypothetical protein
MSQSDAEITNHLWEFLRGDMPVRDFETWLYSSPELEGFLGEDLYWTMITARFSSSETVYQMVKQLRAFAETLPHGNCSCLQLPNLAVIDMDPEAMRAMATFKELKERGAPYWWLYVSECSECHQVWLVAQDESQNDVFCLYRLTMPERDEIVAADHWPTIFDCYEDVKLFGLKTGGRVPFSDSGYLPLVWNITHLAMDHPGIKLAEIGAILNLNEGLIENLCRLAQRSFGVEIIP